MERIGRVINRLATLNRNDSNQRLKQYQLTGNEGSVLMFFKYQEILHQDELIRKLQIDKSAVTRLLQNMQNKGLIERVPFIKDKRCYEIKLTPLGLEKQKIVDQVFEKKDVDLTKGLSKEDLQELRRMLNVLKENLIRGDENE